MQPKSFYFKKSLVGANYQIYINFIYKHNEIKSYPVLELPAGLELNKEYSFESAFDNFNKYFSKIVNDYKPLYAIAFYEMYDFKSLTGIVGDNYDEIKKIYDEKYAWKRDEIDVTEYHYEIVTITIKDVKQNEIDYKKKYNELVDILKRNVHLQISSSGAGFGATRTYAFDTIPNSKSPLGHCNEDFYKLEEIFKKENNIMNETYEYEGLYARCIAKDLVEIKTSLNDKNPIEVRKPSDMSLEIFIKKYADNENYKRKYEELKKEYNKLKKECVKYQERYELFLESVR